MIVRTVLELAGVPRAAGCVVLTRRAACSVDVLPGRVNIGLDRLSRCLEITIVSPLGQIFFQFQGIGVDILEQLCLSPHLCSGQQTRSSRHVEVAEVGVAETATLSPGDKVKSRLDVVLRVRVLVKSQTS
jgi:hypothetical protein